MNENNWSNIDYDLPNRSNRGCFRYLMIPLGCFSVLLIVIGFIGMLVDKFGGGSKYEETTNLTEIEETTNLTEIEKTDDQNGFEAEKIVQYKVVEIGFRIVSSDNIECVYVIENTGNVPLVGKSGYFDLEDENGVLVDVIDCGSSSPLIIAPGEKGVYHTTTMIDIDPAKYVNIKPFFHIQESKKDPIRLNISDLNIYSDEYGWIKFTGRITNTTDLDFSYVHIAIILYDKNNCVVWVLDHIILDELRSGQTISFKGSDIYTNTFDISLENVDRYEVYAYPYSFSDALS